MKMTNEDFKYLNKHFEQLIKLRESGYKCDFEIRTVLDKLHEKMGLEKRAAIGTCSMPGISIKEPSVVVSQGAVNYSPGFGSSKGDTPLNSQKDKPKLLILGEPSLLFEFFKAYIVPESTIVRCNISRDQSQIITEEIEITFLKKTSSTRGMRFDYKLSM
ncbi:hypothetical protein CLI97_00092 [Bacillus velezensis]|uniref:hypothetical protein n=1 Tax=Bacillus velezensis TaxID=492670 RepID=UPI000BB523D3|nr:hypothetical protein [Bacillus velezensis]ATC49429.1 hypothetical protein CLI97_00092 [Bacillus velezensis]